LGRIGAFAAALVAFGYPAFAALADGPPAGGASLPTQSESELDRRIQAARVRGFWVIREGEWLGQISRLFAASGAEARELARELFTTNGHAFIGGNPGKLVVGARLVLPKRFTAARDAPATGAAPAQTVPPPQALSTTPATPASPLAAAPPPLATAPLAAAPPAVQPAAPPAVQPAAPTTVQPAATATVQPAAVAVPATPGAYVDRLLDSKGDERELTLDDRPRDGTPGLRNWSAELRAENRDLSSAGTTKAEGIGLRYAQETERYGDLTLLGQVTHFTPPASDPRGERTKATGTLMHEQFAVGGYTMNSALGVVRPLLPVWLTTSYRVSFSPSMLSGAQTMLFDGRDEVRIAAGRMGQLSGFGIQQFERTSGEQVTASYAHRIDRLWSAGVVAIGQRGNANVPDHQAATFGVSREFAPGVTGVKLQGAASDNGEKAGWFDIQARTGRLVQRFGAYHVDPDFRFGENTSARDVRGAYWRGDYRAGADFYGFGGELTQDNLKRDPARGGNNTAGAYGNVALKLDRTTQVGGGASLRRETPRTVTGSARDVGFSNLFLSKAWDWGVTRLDGNVSASRPDAGGSEHTRVLSWNQEWPRLGAVDVNTLLSDSDEQLVDRNVRRRLANLTLRGPLYGSVRWDAAFTFVDVEDARGGERNYNASVSLDWNPLPAWTFQLLWFRNQVQPAADNPLSPFVRENAVQLNVRYEDYAGTPFPRVAGGRSGTGRIVGSLFFDENGDGVRQANERGAPNVLITLDDRQSALTDSDGRFQFPLVPAGRHRVRVQVDKVPLPWGLEDEAREASVDVRTDTRLDIGLTRIAP
jgi:hypothetical protein